MSFEQKQYWLKGVEYERNRIIKLLKEELANLYGPDRDRIIAIIKGENK